MLTLGARDGWREVKMMSSIPLSAVYFMLHGCAFTMSAALEQVMRCQLSGRPGRCVQCIFNSYRPQVQRKAQQQHCIPTVRDPIGHFRFIPSVRWGI